MHEEPELVELIGSYDTTLTKHVFESFASAAQICLHVRVLGGRNAHHMAESVFKALAKAVDQACQVDPRVKGVPSTKGTLV